MDCLLAYGSRAVVAWRVARIRLPSIFICWVLVGKTHFGIPMGCLYEGLGWGMLARRDGVGDGGERSLQSEEILTSDADVS